MVNSPQSSVLRPLQKRISDNAYTKSGVVELSCPQACVFRDDSPPNTDADRARSALGRISLEFQDCGETTLDDDGTQASDRGLVGSVDGMEHGCAPLGEALIFKRSSRILVHHIQTRVIRPDLAAHFLPLLACQ
jgi:hypothetical protein